MRSTGSLRARNAVARQPRQRDDQDEFRQRQDFADDAVVAQHQGGAERDEVSGDMRDEQALQAEEAGGVDEAAVERQQACDRRRSAEIFSWRARYFGTRSQPLSLTPVMRTVAAAGGFGVPLALLVLELDDLGVAGDRLLGGGSLRGRQRVGMGREGLRKHAIDLVGPAAIVLDDLIGDFGHGPPFGLDEAFEASTVAP